MPVYQPYSFAAIYIEKQRGNASEIRDYSLREKLSDLEDEALNSLDVSPGTVRRALVPHGSMLAWPGEIHPQAITGLFVEALCESLRDHAARCAPAEPVRVRMALHAGESPAGDSLWASFPATVAATLADLPVLRRVLTASVGSPLALIVSDEWHTAARTLHGYQPVAAAEAGLPGPAWIKVPGKSLPPGLTPADAWAPPRLAAPPAGYRHPVAGGPAFHGDAGNVIQAGTINDGVHIGNVYGDVRHRRPDGAR